MGLDVPVSHAVLALHELLRLGLGQAVRLHRAGELRRAADERTLPHRVLEHHRLHGRRGGVELVLGMGLALVVDRLGARRRLSYGPSSWCHSWCRASSSRSVWKILLDPTLGPVSLVLRQLGIGPLGFLGDPGMGMASIVLIDTWWQTAFVFIVLSAGLQALPREPQEAAEVDGASVLQTAALRHAADAQAHHPGHPAVPDHRLPEGVRHHLRHDRRRTADDHRIGPGARLPYRVQAAGNERRR